jgi:hypothetical protein
MKILFASMAVAAFLTAGSFARADDTTPAGQQTSASQSQPVVKKQDASATDTSKTVKPASDAASKYDLSTPVDNLQFHGSVTVGYESTFGKSARQSGMFSQVEINKVFQLSNGATLSLFIGAGRYPNSFGFR